MTALVDFEGAEMPLDTYGRPLFATKFYIAHDYNHPKIPPIGAEIFVRIPTFCVGEDMDSPLFKYSSVGMTSASMDTMLDEFIENCDTKEDAEFLRDKFSHFVTKLNRFIESEDWS